MKIYQCFLLGLYFIFYINVHTPFNCLCSFVKDQLTVFVWAYFETLFYVLLTYVSRLSLISHCIDLVTIGVIKRENSGSGQIASGPIEILRFLLFTTVHALSPGPLKECQHS